MYILRPHRPTRASSASPSTPTSGCRCTTPRWWQPTGAKSARRPRPTSSPSLTTPISSCSQVGLQGGSLERWAGLREAAGLESAAPPVCSLHTTGWRCLKKKEARDFRALQAWVRSLDLTQARVTSCETDIFVGPKQRLILSYGST